MYSSLTCRSLSPLLTLKKKRLFKKGFFVKCIRMFQIMNIQIFTKITKRIWYWDAKFFQFKWREAQRLHKSYSFCSRPMRHCHLVLKQFVLVYSFNQACYADDTQLALNCNSSKPNSVSFKLNSDLPNIRYYCGKHCIKINLSKYSAMLFCSQSLMTVWII